MPPAQLTLAKTGPETEQVVRNLFEHYLHDMSEWFRLDTHPDGSFSYDTSTLWLPGRSVYLARAGADGALAGFAVVGTAERWLGLAGAGVHDMHEFFVLRRYRREGAGAQMARLLWDERPGPWLVRAAAANEPAVAFWRKAIASHTAGAFAEETPVANGRAWSYFRFTAGSARGA